jgi:hypothetical protein
MVFRILIVAVSVALSLPAAAQTPAAQQAARAVTPHGCKKPADFPGRLASENTRRSWVKEANDYLACLKKYAVEHQSAAQALFDQAKPHAEAANSAIDEHNKSALQFKDDQEKGS